MNMCDMYLLLVVLVVVLIYWWFDLFECCFDVLCV